MMKLMPADSPGLERETGIIREGVIFDMEKLFPPTAQLFSQALKNAVSLAHAQGVTAVYTFENYQTSQVLSSGSLKLRTSMCLYGRDVLKDPRGSVIKRASGLKFFLDGSIGAGTAAMSCNYSDGSSFDPLLTDDELMEALELAESLKLIPVFHAIGGRALEQLDRVSHAFLASRGGVFEQGIRVEHAEEIGSAWPGHWNQDNHSFVMQPNFVSRWQHEGGLYEERLGRTGSIGLSPFRTVIDAGFRVAFGSDGMPFGPLGGISGATEHPDPDQSISIHKALKAYTIEAASVCGFRQLSGSLRPDRKADLAVLSASPFETHWSNIEVIGTIFDGIPVYEKHRVLEEL
jgi:predicted amidohydrolase YtcJ